MGEKNQEKQLRPTPPYPPIAFKNLALEVERNPFWSVVSWNLFIYQNVEMASLAWNAHWRYWSRLEKLPDASCFFPPFRLYSLEIAAKFPLAPEKKQPD